jgi:hypothetical protein
VGILDIGFAARHALDVLSSEHPDGDGAFQEIKDRFPEYASHNLAKKVLDWEYSREILHRDLRTCLREQLQASPLHSVSPREGPCSQGPGAPYVQDSPSQPQAPGGNDHV